MTRLTRTLFATIVAAIASIATASSAVAQSPAAPSTDARYDVREVMIPMRDGVKLHTVVYTPKEKAAPAPIVFRRTPYAVMSAAGSFRGSYKSFADAGYAFAFQDIRGRFGSEGTFVMQRPPAHKWDPKATDESTDAYDTIEWLIRNIANNNGRVGMLGVSYDGWTTAMALIDPHPALKVASPQASPADMWLGDDFHHNGAFRLSYGFEYAAMLETSKENTPFAFDRFDTYDWYLSLGPLSNINTKHLRGKIPTWNDYVAHPDWDEFWQRQTIVRYLTEPTVPTLNVAGFWDQEDFYGPIAIYDTLEKRDTKNMNFLVVGPWNHGGWNGAGSALGPIQFGSTTGPYFREQILAPFFAYYLEDKGERPTFEAKTFESGSNVWKEWKSWPPRQEVTPRNIYFGAAEGLSMQAPSQAQGMDSYVSDPAHPVPYRHRPIQATYGPGSVWSTWLVEDQRFVDDRADVLSYEMPVLEEDLTIAGSVTAHLFISTTGSDADYIVKLIDVYPEQYPNDVRLPGYQLMVSNEVFRARYRDSYAKPSRVPTDSVIAYNIDLHTQSYTFKKGHRIMVQVQSTWFPLIDRNPQTWVPNIFDAKAEDYKSATHRVFRSAKYPSHVTVYIVNPVM
ncbi:MAG: CocE/NonD family hydrolase [Longimicrobiales bacterium]